MARTFSFPTLVLAMLATVVAAMGQGQPTGFLAPPPAPEASVYRSLTSSPTRSVIALNGTWQVSRDEGDSWKGVAIPSSYNDEDHLLFRRSFTVPRAMLSDYRWKLVCFGIQYQSTIAINGQVVAQHESGMPFTVNIEDQVALKEQNVITVEVSNRLDYTSTVPLRKLLLGNRTYGGIFRDILLVGVPRVWIDDVRFETKLQGGSAEAAFRVQVRAAAIRGMTVQGAGDSVPTRETINADAGDFELGIAIRGAQEIDTLPPTEAGRGLQPFTLQSKRAATVDIAVPVSAPRLWGPGSPNLYEAVIQVRYKGVVVDEQIVQIGFRSLATRGSQVLLNGSPIELKGIVYVEDSKRYGASLPYALMRKDFEAMRDMGVNLVRFPDGVPHPYILELCDELGLMAVVDFSIGTPPSTLYSDKTYLKRSLDRARFTIDEAAGYTSVVAYGLSASIPGNSAPAVAAVRQLRSMADSLDHRLFWFAASEWGNPALRGLADVAGVGSFDVDPAITRQILEARAKELNGERPLVMLSFGKFVQLENHGGYRDPISIEAQAKYISDIYGILRDVGAAGGIYWSYSDYRTDRPILTVNNENQYLATCGVFGLDRELRQGATMLSALYTDQKAPEVLIGDYNEPSTVLFIATGIGCAVCFLVLINSSRRFRENVFRALLRPFNFYSDIRDQRILSSVQTTLLGVVIAVTFALIFASLSFAFRQSEGFDATLSAIVKADWIKEVLNYVIWRPPLSILLFTVLFFALLILVALLIRLCATFVRNKIFFRDAYVISVWGALPVVILIIPAMILTRLIDRPGMAGIAFTVIIFVVLWMIYRVLRGTAVVYDVRPLKVYGYAIGSIVAILLVIIVTSGEVSATLSYLTEGIGGLYTGR